MNKDTPNTTRPSRFKPYPEYKNSGVEWLGEIPHYWKMSRLSVHVLLINGYPFDSELFHRTDGIPLIRIRDLASQETEVFYSGPMVPDDALVRRGDILIGMDGDFNVSRWRGNEALLNQRLCCLRPRPGIEPRFLAYLIQYPLKVINDLTYSTTVKHLSSLDINKIRLAYPPPAEQSNIASFLDRETAKIDAMVAKKERLIELLQEKCDALISQAVTKGLDPTVPMKDSGVEWLGKIPAHWELLPLRRGIKFLTDFEANGSFDDLKENVITDAKEPFAWYVRATDLENERFGFAEGNHFCDKATYEFLKKTRLDGGELLVTKRGEIGKTYLMPDMNLPATLAPNLYLIRLNERLYPPFVFIWFSSEFGKQQLVLADKSTTIGALYKNDVRSCLCLFPPLNEQRKIFDHINCETAKANQLIAKVREGIEKLKEYRTVLISAAVTGKIDLREEAA